jgi:hypothetical protein
LAALLQPPRWCSEKVGLANDSFLKHYYFLNDLKALSNPSEEHRCIGFVFGWYCR